MNRLAKRVRKMYSLVRPGASLRSGLVLVCALLGGALLGSFAPTALSYLFVWIGSHFRQLGEVPTKQFPVSVSLAILSFILLGAIFGGFIATRFFTGLEALARRWEKMEIGNKVNVFVGIFAGLIAAVPLLIMFQALELPGPYRVLLVFGITLGLGALAVYALQSMEEVLPWTKTGVRQRRSGIKLLDTNVIIDGRIYDVAKTGFLSGEMYVPGFVLDELQYIADSHDALRRQRGRRGLEVLRHMQAEFEMEVRVHDKLAPDTGDGVDARLVRLAKAIGADIVTNDFNLRRVAELQDVHVLSLNDLALALRPNVLPQETFELKIIREGNQDGQGVGYLEDGTMVVVENGKNHVGETMEVVVTQVIQTERGKMIFGEVDTEEEARYETRPRRKTSAPRIHP